ncbi:superoxide dismutase [Patescibacteria group bacterium]|uniref:superoxide dismutase n=1 Tax=candidate division WWE3 bacterium TaxID=2053526 RepID=A0A928TSY5_UNCKA|nr:superoxide dismutase [candidate division WWE3 bacterium]MCL4732665.1 superoxide dismutase [Patescibacteria group bacterium]MDL1952681.1 superoxide dismutase [Candidatus Uhrbacteria bacterium UHB]RIL01188.1 MAG: superoxide dismutase [Candidatus Uhrbacteria bacterium]
MEPKPLPFTGSLHGISDKAMEIHHDKLYAGYVKKKDEIAQKLQPLERGGDLASANQTYSELRALKDGETFAVNGVYLHEWYFDVLGGNGALTGPLVEALAMQYGSVENFVAYFSACGMAARGWCVLAWDRHDKALRVYTGDAHNQGGVWGCMPVIVLDVYEHAYFIDFGSDRKAYIEAFWKNLNWEKANELFEMAKR